MNFTTEVLQIHTKTEKTVVLKSFLELILGWLAAQS